MLAHKATHEGKVAAEVIAGHDVAFDARAIPSVAYTDPEVAWMGLTETRGQGARASRYEKARVPVGGVRPRARASAAPRLTKLLSTRRRSRVLGAGIVGVNAGELIAEAVLAIEMGADAEDIGLTIHPHPTLSETIGFAAEMAEGTITDLMPPKREREPPCSVGCAVGRIEDLVDVHVRRLRDREHHRAGDVVGLQRARRGGCRRTACRPCPARSASRARRCR